MDNIDIINLGWDHTGKNGDSQRTAFEKCNDNFKLLSGELENVSQQVTNSVEDINKSVETALADGLKKFALKGENEDITSLKGLEHNIVQPADASDNFGSVTLRQLNAAVANALSGTGGGTRLMADFIGATQWWNGSRAAIPAGYVSTDGQLLNRADYPELWALLDASILNVVSEEEWWNSPKNRGVYSSGDGSTTFRMPDINGIQEGSIKGLFVRGDGYVPSGSVEGDAIRNITGEINDIYGGVNLKGLGAFSKMVTLPFAEALGTGSGDRRRTTWQSGLFDASQVVPTADENHPAFVSNIHITRVSELIRVETRQEVYAAATEPPSSGDLVFGGVIESSYSVAGSKYASASLHCVKTEGATGTGLQISTVDHTVNPVATRQYLLNSESGEIFTYSSPDDGRRKLGLSNVAYLDRSNTWSQTQVIQSGKTGFEGLVLDTTYNPSSASHNLGDVNRTPAIVSRGSNMGSKVSAGFFCEDVWGVTTRAVIELKNWVGEYNWWTFNTGGNAYATGGSWVNSSDVRLKADFKPIDSGDILDKSKTFRGYTFTRKNTGEKSAGFKAQEIQALLPEAVSVVGDIQQGEEIIEGLLGLDYGAMTAFNHECINALIFRLEKLEKQNEQLAAQLEALSGSK